MTETPKVSGLNHITLAVSDLNRSIAFYRETLGMTLRAEWPEGAYMEAGALWLCLSLDPAARTLPHPDYTHIAFDISPTTFKALCMRIEKVARSWKTNASEGGSLYFLDPDGHKLELHVGSLETRLEHYKANPMPGRIVHDR
ncbi:fosfomycin resistance glutathione transferase [Chelativorans salis]|uniref:Fosfomycin resistance glutathione transferase n=1 Tax=Chelativorans salis TaxID=2978478 RepID=A0ABT2LRF6_9HYPH|nr:fosfomycin resistance glutathione transferase [Chelativorans sp. EGI FJ00035]MCT7376422.1 fosfomycin resistance glutathione transferase [Chelativorans sp. EGI FJ00035]